MSRRADLPDVIDAKLRQDYRYDREFGALWSGVYSGADSTMWNSWRVREEEKKR